MDYRTTMPETPHARGPEAAPMAGDPAAGMPAARSHGNRGVRDRWGPGWLPLLAVLVVQALLSVRLLGADTAFMDEAAYLWAGHLEWAHWLHGTVIPPFSSYFSGAPVMYPPLGALADSVGGLAGARLLSLAFMLGATVLLWRVTGRLFGRQAGFFAAALFAVAGPSLHLGAFATYDAMSLFLLALAAWLVVRAAEAAGGHRAGWPRRAWCSRWPTPRLIPAALFDPVVVALALLTALPCRAAGSPRAAARALLTVLVALLIAGSAARREQLLARDHARRPWPGPGGPPPRCRCSTDAWSWTGVIIVLAVCGVIASWTSRRHTAQTWLLAVLTAAALLGPLEQAHLHTLAALNKHVGLGAWFAAIAAGYADQASSPPHPPASPVR